MGKIVEIPAYSNYSPTLNEIGDTTNITPVSFEVSNITLDSINKYLGTDYKSVSEACKSNILNQWALFRPSGQPPYKIGDFAGYNHIAKPPTFFATTLTTPYITEWQLVSLNSYKCTIGLFLSRGEKPPAVGGIYWSSVRLKVTITDYLNNQIQTTYYSEPKEVSFSGATPFAVDITSNNNIKKAGVMDISGEYYNITTSSKVADIEGSHQQVSFEINRLTNIIRYSDLATTYGETRAYYFAQNLSIAYLSQGVKTDNWTMPNFGVHTEYPSEYQQVMPPSYMFMYIVYANMGGGNFLRMELTKRTGEFTHKNNVYELDNGLNYVYSIEYSQRYAWPTNFYDV